MARSLQAVDLAAVLRQGERRITAVVVAVATHTLLVRLAGATPHGAIDSVELQLPAGAVDLGRCEFVPHGARPLRRHDDPDPEPGDGRLVFVDTIPDFSTLARHGKVGDIQHKVHQLPLVWRRKEGITRAFHEYTADLLYDLQAYRLLLDEIDREVVGEPLEVAERIRTTACAAVYGDFARFMDERITALEKTVAPLARQEHERHGFYFRRHVWDLILASPFLARTNLKPRGYAGDSEMMRMLYEDAFQGDSVFAKFMHRHPVQSAAAQAVRNRRRLIAETLHDTARRRGGPLRVMSVACGPATEVADVLRTREDTSKFSFVLLDQDPDALAEAATSMRNAGRRLGREVGYRTVRESVRTMLRVANLGEMWGRFDFVYTMGLFDYLQRPVARMVLARLYDLLLPGGELLVGNFHVEHPTRVYMEYWMDWVLVYRTVDEMLELAGELPGASADVTFEATRSQMFLRIRKGESC